MLSEHYSMRLLVHIEEKATMRINNLYHMRFPMYCDTLVHRKIRFQKFVMHDIFILKRLAHLCLTFIFQAAEYAYYK